MTFYNNLSAVSPNGSGLWSFGPTAGFTISQGVSPAIGADGTIYIGAQGNTPEENLFFAVNPGGTEKWRLSTPTFALSAAAIGASGTIYVGIGQSLFAIK